MSKRYVDDSKVSDHHAVIPTAVSPEKAHLAEDERKIYDLICRRFTLARQLIAALPTEGVSAEDIAVSWHALLHYASQQAKGRKKGTEGFALILDELPVERRGERAAIAAQRFRARCKVRAKVVANCGVSTPGSWLDQTWGLLEKYGRAGRTEYFPILNSGFEPEDAARILNRAAAFFKLLTLKGTYRHLTMDQRSHADKNTMARGCCPAKRAKELTCIIRWPGLAGIRNGLRPFRSEFQKIKSA